VSRSNQRQERVHLSGDEDYRMGPAVVGVGGRPGAGRSRGCGAVAGVRGQDWADQRFVGGDARQRTPVGPRTCLQATIERPGRKPLVARFDGIPLRRDRTTLVIDKPTTSTVVRRKELVSRLLAGRCEICGGTDGIAVHHARSLADLSDRRQPHPAWVTVMLKKRRKALVVCRDCHTTIHTGG
jgi:hypothetical protein